MTANRERTQRRSPLRNGRTSEPGFALVISLSLMGFLVLLMLSLTSVVRLESQVATVSQMQEEARRNALAGLSIALGELQRHLGPDQRVTAPATTVLPSKDELIYSGPSSLYQKHANTAQATSYLNNARTWLTPKEREDFDTEVKEWWAEENRQPHWTAVYDSSLRRDAEVPAERYEDDPDKTRFGEPDRSQDPIWLVSGNASLAPSSGDYLTPENFNSLVPVDERVTLVDAGSAPLNTTDDPAVDGLDGRVLAKRVPVNTAGTGHYAYWIGDESTKHHIAVEDPFRDNTDPLSVAYRNRLISPLYAGWRGLSKFNELLTESEVDGLIANQEIFRRLIDFDQSELLQGDLGGTSGNDYKDAAARQHFHHATAASISVLTDPVLGGLKQDLTRFLEDGEGHSDLDAILDKDRYVSDDPRFDAYVTSGTTAGFPNSDLNLAKWSDLRFWYENQAGSTAAAAVEPNRDFAPIITRMSFHGGWSYDTNYADGNEAEPVDEGEEAESPAIPPSDLAGLGVTGVLRFHWMPVITLWNPYDTGLAEARYEIELNMGFNIKAFTILTQNATDANIPEVSVSPTAPGEDPPYTGDFFVSKDGYTDSPTIGGASPDEPNAFGHRLVEISGNLGDAKAPHSDDQGGVRAVFEEGGDPNRGKIVYSYTPFGDSTDAIRFRYKIRTALGPGESRVFAVDPIHPVRRYSVGRRVTIPLENVFLDSEPGHISWGAVGVIRGPISVSENQTPSAGEAVLRMVGITPPGSANLKPYPYDIEFSVNESEPIVIPELVPDFQVNKGTARFASNELVHITNSNRRLDSNTGYIPTKLYVGNALSKARRIYPTADYVLPSLLDDSVNHQNSPIFYYGDFFLDPLIARQQDRLHGSNFTWYHRLFAQSNIRARRLTQHPLEDHRDKFATNNSDRLGKFSLAVFDEIATRTNSDNAPWSRTKVDDSYRGFSLLSVLDLESRSTLNESEIVGLTVLGVYNARRANSNILSLAQFNSANLAESFWQPGFAIGNSEASPFVDRAGITGLTSYEVGATTGKLPGGVTVSPQTWPNNVDNDNIDLSYLLNENLWDRYFLSGIASSGSIDPDDPEDFPNPRLRPLSVSGAEDPSDFRDFETAAAHLAIFGGFNVNSTSEEAWKALLTSFRDLEISSQSGDTNPRETAPVSRSFSPVTHPVDLQFDDNFIQVDTDPATFGAEGTDAQFNYSKVLGGFRYLNDAMIGALAERIVDEVRIRGPFFGVADFVNRRLVSPSGAGSGTSAWTQGRKNGNSSDQKHLEAIPAGYDPVPGMTGICGAVQRAINVSGINGGMNYPGTPAQREEDRVFGVPSSLTTSSNLANAPETDFGKYHFVHAGARSYLDTEHLAGAPASEAGQLFSHTPGFVTQANVLNLIGSVLTARGDTFRIRVYGDAADPITGEKTKAYLEALVQRITEPVTPSSADRNSDKFWEPMDSLGRQFRIIGLRWLTPEEI